MDPKLWGNAAWFLIFVVCCVFFIHIELLKKIVYFICCCLPCHLCRQEIKSNMTKNNIMSSEKSMYILCFFIETRNKFQELNFRTKTKDENRNIPYEKFIINTDLIDGEVLKLEHIALIFMSFGYEFKKEPDAKTIYRLERIKRKMHELVYSIIR